ncbi:hypothetical protein ISCGN_007120 [Ixodes scapularis]
MGQRPLGDPYPFELIKRKTLEFLSETLPLLRRDPNLPKVARLGGPQRPLGLLGVPPPLPDLSFSYYQRGPRKARSHNATLSGDLRLAQDELREWTSNSSLRQLCRHGSGTVCTLFSALSTARISTALLQTIVQMLTARTPSIADKVQAAPSTQGSTASGGSGGGATNLLSMLTYAADIINAINPDASSSSTTPSPPIVNRSPLTQVLSALTGATGSSAASSSPLVTVLDMMTSDSSPIKLLANVYNQRKKKPVADQSAQSMENDVDGGLPPTPCPSLEEYVTPTFARNYQGVWKYVVQIPHEGYLTQTVQQTKCISTRCDFVEGGLCYESPRWVSLLVAEVFYPNAVFPTASPQRRHATRPRLPAVHDFHHFQQYLNRRARPALQAQRRQDGPRPWADAARAETKCDGHDQVGCYVVRMYYDWFLVNGSCKCWKPSGKQVFAGGRRRRTSPSERP